LSLEQAHAAARAKADVSIDPADHAYANALASALVAQQWRHDRHHRDVPGHTDDLPPWSAATDQ
jgi:hypothetical protein